VGYARFVDCRFMTKMLPTCDERLSERCFPVAGKAVRKAGAFQWPIRWIFIAFFKVCNIESIGTAPTLRSVLVRREWDAFFLLDSYPMTSNPQRQRQVRISLDKISYMTSKLLFLHIEKRYYIIGEVPAGLEVGSSSAPRAQDRWLLKHFRSGNSRKRRAARGRLSTRMRHA